MRKANKTENVLISYRPSGVQLLLEVKTYMTDEKTGNSGAAFDCRIFLNSPVNDRIISKSSQQIKNEITYILIDVH